MILPDLDTQVRNTWFCHDAEDQILLIKQLVVGTGLLELQALHAALVAGNPTLVLDLEDRIGEYKKLLKKVTP